MIDKELTTLYIVFEIVNNIRLLLLSPLQPVHDLNIILFNKKRKAIFIREKCCSDINPGFACRVHFFVIIYKFFDHPVRLFLFEIKCVTETVLGNGLWGTVAGESITYFLKKIQTYGGACFSKILYSAHIQSGAAILRLVSLAF